MLLPYFGHFQSVCVLVNSALAPDVPLPVADGKGDTGDAEALCVGH